MTLVSIPANPTPEGAVTGMLKTRDGMALRFARWPPPPGRKGTVCLFQGRAEFIECGEAAAIVFGANLRRSRVARFVDPDQDRARQRGIDACVMLPERPDASDAAFDLG